MLPYEGICPKCGKNTVRSVESKTVGDDEYTHMFCSYCSCHFYIKRDAKLRKYFIVDTFGPEAS